MVIGSYAAVDAESRSYLAIARDKVLSRCTIAGVETLSARIQWILDHCRRGDGSPWDAKSLGAAAGLKAPAHVGMMRRGTIKRPAAGTLEAIARAAGVSHRWLVTGAGSPDGDDDGTPSSDGVDDAAPKFGALPNWAELRRTAKALEPSLEDWALDVVAESNPLAVAPITAGQVAKVAKIAMELIAPPVIRTSTARGTRKA
jgi:hypothetical protein